MKMDNGRTTTTKKIKIGNVKCSEQNLGKKDFRI